MEEQLSFQNGVEENGDEAVVRCPSCNTDFLIDRALLSEAASDIDEPFLHCSRCDYVFKIPAINGNAPKTERPALQLAQTPSPKLEQPASAEITGRVLCDLDDDPGRKQHRKERDSSFLFASRDHSDAVGASSPALRIGLALVGMVFALAIVSLFFYSSPSSLNRFIAAAHPGMVAAPPSDLYLDTVSLQWITLSDGETVPVLEAVLVNEGESHFKEVLVEGRLYSKRTQVEDEVVTSPIRRSSRRELRLMSRESLAKLASEANESPHPIGPGERMEIMIPFTPVAESKANLYTARVFSIRGGPERSG